MTSTAGMTGGGYYDDHSEYQRRVAGQGAALVRTAVAELPLPAEGTTVIADFGSSTGRNSITSVGAAVAAVRQRAPERPIAVVHNDLPSNDWNELFTNLASSPDSYLHLDGPAVLPMVSATSFFSPALPRRSLHLGLSFSAAHWFRDQPDLVVPHGFYFCDAVGAPRRQLAAAAADDWVQFLQARAAELVPGGHLVVQMVGTAPNSDGGEPRVTARLLLRAMAEIATTFVDEGRLDAETADRYLLAVYARSVEEAMAPLRDPGGLLHGLLEVVTCRIDPVPNPYLDQWEADGDAAAYAAGYGAFVRGFTESSLRQHLFEPGARDSDPDTLLEDYFSRLTARFAEDPRRDRFEDWTLSVVARRV